MIPEERDDLGFFLGCLPHELNCHVGEHADVGRLVQRFLFEFETVELLQLRRLKPQLMVSSAKLFSQLLVVAVGMAITGHPPHRSERTGFPYSALASGHPPKRADG